MNSILVTGGAGFIGSHTSLLLLEKGYHIYVVDSCVKSNYTSIDRLNNLPFLHLKDEKINFFKGDISDSNFLEKIFMECKKNGRPITSVIHFAGLKSVEESVNNPFLYWEVNVGGTLKLLDIMEKFECYSFIFSSSATIYGPSNKSPIKEDDFIEPNTPYGKTKYAVEQITQDLYACNPKKWKIANLRYFNPIGAHHSGLIGEDPNGIPSNIFPLINRAAYGQLKNLEIYGNDWDTPDGTGIRDYIHVMDLAEGHVRTLELLLKSNAQIINMNLGTGFGTSVLQLIDAFQKANNVKVPYTFSKRRSGDRAESFADNSLAKKILNWEPKRDIYQMCRDGWNWHQKISDTKRS